MIEHNLKVKDDIIEPVSLVIPSGNVETHVLILDFNDTWTDLKKMAVFTRDGTAKEYTIDGNTRTIPGDILSDSGEFTVGVYGYIMDGETLVKRLSTNILTGKVIKGAYSNAEQGESDVPPSAYEKLESTVENHIDNHENPHEVTADQVGAYGKQAIDDAFSGMNRKIAAKLDKVKSDFVFYPKVYATTDTDGTPYLIIATSNLGYIGKASGFIATYDGGELKTGTPTVDDSAANKAYVDSEIKSLQEPYELIEEITLTEATSLVTRDKWPNGDAYSFSKIRVEVDSNAITAGFNTYVRYENDSTAHTSAIMSNAGVKYFATFDGRIENGYLTETVVNTNSRRANNAALLQSAASTPMSAIQFLKIWFNSSATLNNVGTTIRIYGVRA